jgi:hypothetical protein
VLNGLVGLPPRRFSAVSFSNSSMTLRESIQRGMRENTAFGELKKEVKKKIKPGMG